MVPPLHKKKNKPGAKDAGTAPPSAPAAKKASLLRGLRLVGVGVALGGAGENLLGDEAGILPDRGLDLRGHVGVGLQERLRILAALAEALAAIGDPGAGLFDDAGLCAAVEDFAH